MNIAIVTAAGIGTRAGQDVPKQFINIYDKPLIIYTLECFQNHPEIDAIYVAILDGWEEYMDHYAKRFGISKLKGIVKGGNSGQKSIENVLEVVAKERNKNDIVIVHDGSRPYLEPRIITENIEVCKKHGNAVTAIDTREAVLVTNDKLKSTKSISRDILYRTQTPHTMYLGEMMKLHKEALDRDITESVATCTLLIECGYTVWFVKGSDLNFKITSKEDLLLFKALLVATGRVPEPKFE